LHYLGNAWPVILITDRQRRLRRESSFLPRAPSVDSVAPARSFMLAENNTTPPSSRFPCGARKEVFIKTFLFLLCLLFVRPSLSSAQATSAEKIIDMTEKCGLHPMLLRDKVGKLVWFSPEQLQSRIVATVPLEKPTIPRQKYTGQVSMHVIINAKGNVICQWGGAGHPVMLSPAFRAVHEWRFKPLLSDGKPAEYVGTLKVHVESAD